MSNADVASRLRSVFDNDPHGALAVYLFGSTARGTSRPNSDVDLAILYKEVPAPGTLDSLPLLLQGELEKFLNRPVDVIVLNTASPDLCHRIFRDGIVVLDRDRSFRIHFEVKRRNEYLDFLPVLQLYRRYPEQRVES